MPQVLLPIARLHINPTLNHYDILYVPVTLHREQSVKKEYQQDATIQMIYCQL